MTYHYYIIIYPFHLRVTSHIGEDHSAGMTLFINKLNVIIKRFAALIPKHKDGGASTGETPETGTGTGDMGDEA